MIRNANTIDPSGSYNEAYFLDVTMGDTDNIFFEKCEIKDYNVLVGAVKLLVHKNDSISPALFSDCTFECPTTAKSSGSSYLFISEGATNEQEVAHISNSTIIAGPKIICANGWINFDTTKFILDRSIALDSYNIADNCRFEISNCTQSSRAFRNGRCTVNNSTIVFNNANAEKLYIQPKELNNTKIESVTPVTVQYGYSN